MKGGGPAGAEAGKSEATGRKLPATPPREPKNRPQKKKKISKSEIGAVCIKQIIEQYLSKQVPMHILFIF